MRNIFLAGNLAAFDNIRAFFGREEVIDVKTLKYFLADTINTAYTLNNAGRIPGNVIVDDGACTVEVDTFRKLVTREQDFENHLVAFVISHSRQSSLIFHSID